MSKEKNKNMPKVISPVSDPDQIRKEAEQNAPAQISVQPTAVIPDTGIDASQHYQTAKSPGEYSNPNAAAALAIQGQKRRPLIGLYIVIGLLLLSALSSILTDGPVSSKVSGVLTGLLAFGLLTRSNIARLFVVILGWISVALSLAGFLLLFGFSSGSFSTTHAIFVGMIVVQVAILIYLSSARVKAEFN